MTPALSALDDNSLVNSLRRLVSDSNATEAELLLHLGELDARRLYAPLGYSSSYAYCTEALGFSHYPALERIGVARLARRHPNLLAYVRDGRLNVTALRILSSILMEDDCSTARCEEIATQALGRSSFQVHELRVQLKPKEPTPDSIRKVPSRPAAPSVPLASPVAVAAPPTRALTEAPAPTPRLELAPTPAPAPKIEPLAPDTYKVAFTADAELLALIRECEALLSHRKDQRTLPKMVKRGMQLLAAALKKERFGIGAKPRAKPEPTSSEAPPPAASRHVPRDVTREVAERDGLQCSFVSDDGHRCGETSFLQVEHLQGFARTREHSAATTTYRCFAHNQHGADLLYGRDFMDGHRPRPATRFKPNSQPSPSTRFEPTSSPATSTRFEPNSPPSPSTRFEPTSSQLDLLSGGFA